MTLTEQEIQQAKDIFYLQDGVDFDIYHRRGANHELGEINLPELFEPPHGNFKSTIQNSKLILVIIKGEGETFTYVGEDNFLVPGLGL